jgi:uncharacterized protein YndB with AHSA1/START domain
VGLQLGHLYIRRSTFINATPERTWQEFASFETLRDWFGTPFLVPGGRTSHTLLEFEPRAGGSIRLSVGLDGEARCFGGRVLVCEPARELSFENNWEPPHAEPVSTFITIRLASLYGGTHVELFHHGFERWDARAGEMLEGYESGWHPLHLEALRSIVES